MTENKLFHCREFARFFAMALANATLYSPHHPQVIRLAAKAYQSLMAAMGGEEQLAFLLIDDQMVADHQPLEKGVYTARVRQAFHEKRIEHVEFSAKTTEEDLLLLIRNLLNPSLGYADMAPNDHIRFGKIALEPSEDLEPGLSDGAETPFLPKEELPGSESRILAEIYEQAKKKRHFSLSGVAKMVSGLVKFLREDLPSFLALAAIQDKDGYTFTHSTNVSILNLAQAISLGIEDRLVHDIGIAGMLHDVGKLFIPEEILCKPGRLTEEELAVIRQHPVQGAAYLYDIPQIPPLAVSTAFEHHMKFNGGGYPKVPAGWTLNLCSQITSISDTFDAIRTRRSYQEPANLETSKEILQKIAGAELNPALTRNFIGLIDSARV
ncbi:MAG: HD domain-containing protein [Deltaproteobacteria bacterium]|nr:HD domain-containing protein [Deltaproteobacteria bacterium]